MLSPKVRLIERRCKQQTVSNSRTVWQHTAYRTVCTGPYPSAGSLSPYRRSRFSQRPTHTAPASNAANCAAPNDSSRAAHDCYLYRASQQLHTHRRPSRALTVRRHRRSLKHRHLAAVLRCELDLLDVRVRERVRIGAERCRARGQDEARGDRQLPTGGCELARVAMIHT